MKARQITANLALAIGAPLLFFAATELVLKVAGVQPLSLTEDAYVGYSAAQTLFVDSTGADGSAFKVTNPVKLSHFNPQAFPAKKAPGTYRIFTLGGSTTYGHPFHDPTSYTGWLRAFLGKTHPGRRYEVINCGGISYASYREAQLMAELIRYEPDLFVIYTGQNEFLEERTYRGVAAIPGWARTASGILERTRAYSSLKRLLRRSSTSPKGGRVATSDATPASSAGSASSGKPSTLASEVDDVLAKTIGPTSYTRDDSLKAGITEHFRFSLDRMGRLAEAAGARIVYVTTPVNEKDCAPFKSEPTPGLGQATLQALFAQRGKAQALRAAGHDDSAYALLNDAANRNPRDAGLRYEAGQAALALRLYPEAKAHLRAAIEEDVCPLRALRVFDTAVRQAATRHGGSLLDFVDTLERVVRDRDSTGGMALLGAPDFLDHVHLDLDGYRRLALGLLDELVRLGALPASARTDSGALRQVTDSLYALMTPAERGLALTNLAKVINWAGKHDEAAHLAEQALQLDSTSLEAIWSSLFVGALRERTGLGLASLPHYYRAVSLDPNNPESRMHLGAALLRLDSLDAAQRELTAAMELAPDDPDIRAQWEKLRLRRSQTVTPTIPEGLDAKLAQAEALLAAKQWDKAEAAFVAILQNDAGQARAYEGLGHVSAAQGNIPQAIQYFARASQIDPGRTSAKQALSRLLQGLPVGPVK